MKSELRSQLLQVRKEISELLFEQQQLLWVTGPNLEARYLAAIGRYDKELQQVQLDIRRARRHLEIRRAALQKNLQLVHEDVEKQLDLEFLQWRRQLDEEDERQAANQQRLRRLRSPESSSIQRSLYRQLVKRLHPDLHPQQTPHQQQLWFEVQQAYQWADWEKLETLLAVSDDEFEESLQELERLRQRLSQLSQDLQELRQRFPFNLGGQLEDECWVEQQAGQRKLQILLERQRLNKLEAMLQEFY